MKRLIVLAVMMLVIGFGVRAQGEASGYRLRVPSAEEYLIAVPEIVNAGNEEYESEYSRFNYPLFNVITTEIYRKYPDFRYEDAELLHTAYLGLRQYNDYWYDRDIWVHAFLLAWINQQSIDLSQTSQLDFHDFVITVIPRDYNNDGADEWLLRVVNPDFTQDIVFDGEKERYTIVESPLPWFGCCFAYWSTQSGFTEELKFEDITGDDLPEWVIALGGVGGGQKNNGRLYILQWYENRLIDLAPQYESYDDIDKELFYDAPAGGGGAPLFPRKVQVRIENIDDDKSLEIVIQQTHTDNWDCDADEIRIFKWDEQVHLYQLGTQDWNYANSAGCSLRNAQAAMWENNYSAAIPLLERSLEQFAAQEFDDPNSYEAKSNRRYAAYASVRLALAFSLVGRSDDASRILNLIQVPDDLFMATLVQRSQEAYREQKSFDLCLAMYDVAAGDFFRYFGSFNVWLGLIQNDPVSGIGVGYPTGDPGLAGCDVDLLIGDEIQSQPFSTQSSPLEKLTEDGITVGKSFRADLNEDGIDEWMIWLPSKRLNPILFLSDEEIYRISRPPVGYPDEYTQITAWRLPEDAGTAFLRLYFDDQTPLEDRWYYTSGGGGGPIPRCADEQGNFINFPDNGWLEIWQLQDEELSRTQWNLVCASTAFDDLFPNGERSNDLHVWYGLPGEDFNDYPAELTVLTWDNEQKRFIAPEEIRNQIETNEAPLISFSVQDVRAKMNEGVYDEELLSMINALLDHSPSDANPSEISELHSYRSLALEALNRLDEALAEYMSIYEGAPESAWGRLAALHLEAGQ
jgi:hypothetical protein